MSLKSRMCGDFLSKYENRNKNSDLNSNEKQDCSIIFSVSTYNSCDIAIKIELAVGHRERNVEFPKLSKTARSMNSTEYSKVISSGKKKFNASDECVSR